MSAIKKIKIEYEEDNPNASSSSNPGRGLMVSSMMHPPKQEDTKEDIKPHIPKHEDTKEDIKPHIPKQEDTKDDIKPHIENLSCESEREQEYKQRVMSNYQPMHRELYEMNPPTFFVPSFLSAIHDNTREGFKRIITEPSPGILTFQMLKPEFCKMLMDEFKNFEKWAGETGTRIMHPTTMYKYGAILDHFGLEKMLGRLMEDFILPMSTVFFPEVGGAMLDSHHGFIVEYGAGADVYLDFHVDDSEVTLNVCLGEQFSGGELFFRGVRCVKHVNVESELDEIFDYSQVPGRAVLHRGRHRHCAVSTTSGHRVNMLLWCKSSVFREMTKDEQNSPSWCGICRREQN
ncbi:2-oxoglutarate and iron-dependent oxygenase domain-containing protein CP2-like [Apium graveolens]|uniref:2-oxoglutarate and iron-dependent oxygenase domain-containing protein CP2-like n=1 Tax=Apium graveolens TaxID=4045 RepID=UPI003D7AFF94